MLAAVVAVAVLAALALWAARGCEPTDASGTRAVAANVSGTAPRMNAAEGSEAMGPDGAGTDVPASAAGGLTSEAQTAAEAGVAETVDPEGREIVEARAFTLPFRNLEIAADMSGVVETVEVEEGDRVHSGQVLVKLKSDVLEAQQAWRQAQVASAELQLRSEQTNWQVATRESDRMEGLYAEQVITERDYIKAKLEKDLAGWRVRAAMATLKVSKAAVALADRQLEQTIIRAPIAGQILYVAKRPGEAVEVPNPILQMVQVDPLFVLTNVPVATFGRIRPGM
jgi:RND family efflux transporter MFP subunit